MCIESINFNVEIFSMENNILKVTLLLKNIKTSKIELFKNKVRASSIRSNLGFTGENKFIYITKGSDTEIKISYLVSISYPSKHGIYGVLSKDAISFGGEQFLILPVSILNGKNPNCNITIDFDFSNFDTISIPFKNHKQVNLSICNWSNIYELLKSSYSFSNFKTYTSNEHLTLSSDKKISKKTLNNLESLYNYYSSLFKIKIKLHINSISINSQYKLFSGSSRSIISAEFDFENKRDWQLLSHRIFHAFMDSKLDNVIFHVPPNLWVTEGLATYYEHKALEVLDADFKRKLKISFEEEFKTLHRIHRYSLGNNPQVYRFPPMAEGELKRQALIEYLHYYKAPLLINFFEEESPLNLEDKFINYLISLDGLNSFSQVDMFYYILKNKINEFSMRYIFGSDIIPTSLDLNGDFDHIRTSIESFEHIMNSWFLLDNVVQ